MLRVAHGSGSITEAFSPHAVRRICADNVEGVVRALGQPVNAISVMKLMDGGVEVAPDAFGKLGVLSLILLLFEYLQRILRGFCLPRGRLPRLFDTPPFVSL